MTDLIARVVGDLLILALGYVIYYNFAPHWAGWTGWCVGCAIGEVINYWRHRK